MTRDLTQGSPSRRAIGLALHAGAALLLVAVGLGDPAPTAMRSTEEAAPKSAAMTQQLMQSFALNDYKRELDGQWQGIRLASDGNVYFASSSHSAHHGAAFFKYDTTTGEVSELVHEITDICGEDVETNPQGKIHSDIVEANGWLYMATHFAAEKPGVYETWTGAHALGYELATGIWRDYGVILPGYTAYSAIGVDPARNFLYVFLTGQTAGQASYMYRIETVTGEKTNLGQVSAPSDGGGGYDFSSFWTFVDQRGDVWFSIKNQGGDLQQIHGDTGLIEVHANALPPLVRWDSDQLETDPALQSSRSVWWMQPLDGDRALLTMMPNGGVLYTFDSTQPMASAFTEIRHIGFTSLGLAVGGNRVFYYQRENRASGIQDAPQNFHLVSVSLDEAAGYPIIDHGLMVDQDGRKVWRMPGMMADGQGRVYTIGDWWTVAGDLGTLRYDWNGGNEIYEQLPRGEFFAVGNVTIPPPSPIDLSITGSAAPDPVMVNGTLTYTLQVTNNAATEATGVTVSDLLPANVTYVSATTAAGTCSKFSSTVTCQILSLAGSASATITIVVKSPVPGTLSNTASVTANESDPDTANSTATQTTTVLDTVQFGAHTYTVAEAGASVSLTVTRAGTGVISVDYATGNNTASAGSDYMATSGTLVFAASEASKTLSVPITSDAVPEGHEALNLTLSSPVGALIGRNGNASLTILDDDVYTPPTLNFSAADFTVGEATATKSITVNRTGDSTGTTTVQWSAASNTATLGVDFGAAGGVLTFGPGVTSRSFTVSVTNDTAAEGNESGHLILSAPTGGARLGTSGNATLTIVDNDVSASGFKFSGTYFANPESGSKAITISRTTATAAQSVTFTTSNGTAAAGIDYTAVTAIVSFAVGEATRTVNVPILADTIVESRETINLTLSNPTGGGTLAAQRTAILFITDTDTNGSLQFKTATFSVAEGTPNATITVTRTGGTYGAVDVSYATGDNTATAGSDYTTRSGTLSFGQGQTSKTFTVPILNDAAAERAESLNLTLSGPTGGATLGQARRVVLTITDND